MPRPPASWAAIRLGDESKQLAVARDLLALQQFRGLADGPGNLLAAGNLAEPGVAVAVGDDDDVAREEGPVGAAEIEQHAVVAGNGDDLDSGDLG